MSLRWRFASLPLLCGLYPALIFAQPGPGGNIPHLEQRGAVAQLIVDGKPFLISGGELYNNSGWRAAVESTFGSRNAGDLPVDSHDMLALCAPRPTFISFGVPEKGDAKWLDHQGSFMAAIAAQPVYRLLGGKDLGRSDDYLAEKMPAVNVGLLGGRLAWRQHDGGHTDAPNWKYFIPWADKKMIGHKPVR